MDVSDGGIPTLGENILDTSSPTIYSTGSADDPDSVEDNVIAGTSTQVMNRRDDEMEESTTDNSNNEEPALRRSTRQRVANISPDFVY